ncbi:MAG: thioredoxin family protein [Phycisphaerales bacterium]|nr:thioredoxin family protein [Planctomycetota bacterium]MCH8508890.1 thioredoxin family protein [Phycisphaerales bacterium]
MTSPPPPEIQAWMDRLTVDHAYDPATGFIVARQTITLPAMIADAPTLDEAVRLGEASGALVIAFATADRCAPCQQYKKDALNDPSVLGRLSEARFIATHVEVDRQPDLADRYLGSRAIPMTYAIRDGRIITTLRGQRSAADLLTWLDALPAS